METGKDLILKLCKDVLEKGVESKDVSCRGIHCYEDNCPFIDDEEHCFLRKEGVSQDVAKKYISESKGRKLKTLQEVIGTIKSGETWVGCENAWGNPTITKGDYGITFEFGLQTNEYTFWDNTLFRLEQEKHNFSDALKSFNEGREVESLVSGVTYKKLDDYNILVTHENGTTSELPIGDSLFSLTEIQGEWYIY